MLRDVSGEDADLVIGDLACTAGVWAPNTARPLALLEEAGLGDHRHRILCSLRFNDLVACDFTQCGSS